MNEDELFEGISKHAFKLNDAQEYQPMIAEINKGLVDTYAPCPPPTNVFIRPTTHPFDTKQPAVCPNKVCLFVCIQIV